MSSEAQASVIPGLSEGGVETQSSDVAMAETGDTNGTSEKVDQLLKTAKQKAGVRKKRKAEGGGDAVDIGESDGEPGPQKPKRKRKQAGPPSPKNALMQLNELKPGLTYELVSQVGPVHDPVFTMKVIVNGNEFTGIANSKKRAKLVAAERALASFVQFRNASEAHLAMGRNVVNSDFTIDADDLADAIMIDFDGKETVPGGPPIESGKKGQMRPPPQQPKNALMLLNEEHPGITYDVVSEEKDGNGHVFVMSVKIEDKVYQGSGKSKKQAKKAAAQAALKEVHGVDFTVISGFRSPANSHQLPLSLSDNIMQLVYEKFKELTQSQSDNYKRRKVLAGFVVVEGEDFINVHVASIATGTKCIGGEYISDRGLALNDCHAEIIARRGFIRYLYAQLNQLLAGSTDHCILEAKPNGKGYKMKDQVRIYLYISTSPCGDARIFSPHEVEDITTADSDKHPNRNSRGQLRTKIESGEGTIPVKSNNSVQTWDGVLQGERLLTMSCSDKVCKWNIVGIQGSLLSHFIDPIYLYGIILGSLFHVDHMSRAMYGRLGVTESSNLPEPYQINKPFLSGITCPENRQPGKAPSFSVNWSHGDAGLEMINCTTGKAEDNQPSRVCKQSLFKLFCNIRDGLTTTYDTPPPPAPTAQRGTRGKRQPPAVKQEKKILVYGEMKHAVPKYKSAKEGLYKLFTEAGLGSWVGKPVEQDQFTIDSIES